MVELALDAEESLPLAGAFRGLVDVLREIPHDRLATTSGALCAPWDTREGIEFEIHLKWDKFELLVLLSEEGKASVTIIKYHDRREKTLHTVEVNMTETGEGYQAYQGIIFRDKGIQGGEGTGEFGISDTLLRETLRSLSVSPELDQGTSEALTRLLVETPQGPAQGVRIPGTIILVRETFRQRAAEAWPPEA